MENSLIQGLVERISQAASMHSSVGVVLPSNNYHNFNQAVFEFMRMKNMHPWVYVTTTKPYNIIKQQQQEIIESINVRFIDCVSLAAGITPDDDRCYYLDSPSQLEKLILEVMSFVKEKAGMEPPFIIIDSLSSLSLFNDELLVTEFLTHLVNNLRLYNAHLVSLCIDEEMNDTINKMLYIKNEKILKIQESFI